MDQELIHVYLMPGMAANPSIFEYIKLPEDQFKIHWLEWEIPLKKESLQDYAKRMCLKVTERKPVLLGVSFGGVLVQEMSKFLDLRKLILVSTVKTKYEIPKRLQLVAKTKAYKILPTQLLGNVKLLAKYVFGETLTKRAKLYEKYLSVSNKRYLNWAIREMVCWNQEIPIPNCIHIHGEDDAVFPIANISNYKPIAKGTHVMIIYKYKWFNQNLPKIILS
ncbi:alpha/beta hydrolase [Aurantibacter sp.]|uniref:alpha/beta hydrolase n=1 Tax=Aurantibacter sp. TaxID=2807103 RepID=UPI0035C7B3A5